MHMYNAMIIFMIFINSQQLHSFIHSFINCCFSLFSVVFFPLSLLSGGGDGLVAVYDISNEINKLGYTSSSLHPSQGRGHSKSVSCMQWFPFDTGMFISGDRGGQVAVWDTNEFMMAHSFNMGTPVHAARMSAVAQHTLIASK